MEPRPPEMTRNRFSRVPSTWNACCHRNRASLHARGQHTISQQGVASWRRSRAKGQASCGMHGLDQEVRQADS